jgi:hypothetical protein
MATRSTKTGMSLFSRLTPMKSVVFVIAAFGMIALICAFGCEQRTGVRPSTGDQSQATTAGTTSLKSQPLADAQCVNCHPQQPQTVETQGGKHKTEVGCQDCHVEHPPLGDSAVPACNMCHTDGAHYELENCSNCHSDTHAPLAIKLEGDIAGPCLTCHPKQGEEVKAQPSAHTDLACNECHAAHRQIPNCMECHEKHTADMDFEACKTCHPVHMPLVVAYPDEIPSRYCGGCHEDAVSLLQANTTKHHDLACAYCHKQQHKAVPPCQECHGVPHPARMLQKFPNCGDCHSTAHDLK